MADQDVPVVLDTTKIYEIEEHQDFDRHETVHARKLGEDWGDGFFVQEEPVIVDRKPDGSIKRLRPISELEGVLDLDDDAPPVQGSTLPGTRLLSLTERQKLVEILAMRMIRWWKSRKPNLREFNPIYDGIPTLPSGAAENLQPRPGSKLYPASEQQIFDWLKRDVLGPRISLINKHKNWDGYAGDVAMRITRDPQR